MGGRKKFISIFQAVLLLVVTSVYIAVSLIINFYIIELRITLSLIPIIVVTLPFLLFLFVILIYLTSDWRKKARVPLVILTIIGTIIYASSVITLGYQASLTRFTYERWVKAPEERIHIIDDLLKTHRIVGIKKKEVISLLGTPTETDYFKAPNRFVYYLGPERGIISIDSEWLLINFDDQDIVISTKIARD